MKKIMTHFLLYCSMLQCTWASQSEVQSLIPASHPTYEKLSIGFNNNAISGDIVKGGGYGGNDKIGQLTYAGLIDTLPSFKLTRSANNKRCYLENDNTRVFNNRGKVISFECITPDPYHDYLYWDEKLGAVNGGYSPENDTLYAVDVVTNMMKDWYDIPAVINSEGFQAPINVHLHSSSTNNAYTSGNHMYISDGGDEYYPFTSLPIMGYLMGQVFTDQHSELNFFDSQSGGINIAFSCMTAMAAEFYATKKNSWQVGLEISKNNKGTFHYMDVPSKNCNGSNPGDNCDIDTFAQYYPRMLQYYSSGLFSRAFYFLATSSNWDTHKAYDVFLYANLHHWKRNTNFQSGACDVVSSAKELGYEPMSVMRAFSRVGIDTRDC